VNSPSESEYTFDAENRVKARTYGAATETYTYDGAGTMLKRTATGASGSETVVYLGGAYEANLTTGVVTKYYQAAGRAIAMCKGGAVQYLLADHLGTTTAVLDAAGAVVSSRAYWPYGADRALAGDGRTTALWYTYQRDEDFDGLGLYNYKARFYSTTLGRFVSADPATPKGSSMPLNRFAYADDNPLRFIDPSGFDPTPEDIANCAAHLLECLTFSFAANYGSSDVGLIIVGGHNQNGLSIGSFEYLVKEFLALTSNCASRVGECYAALSAIIAQPGGYDAAYSIFGVRFIHTGNGDVGAVLGMDTPAGDALEYALSKEGAEGKRVLGVVGFSLGANVALPTGSIVLGILSNLRPRMWSAQMAPTTEALCMSYGTLSMLRLTRWGGGLSEGAMRNATT
jgi:RHS repeat-associated protein